MNLSPEFLQYSLKKLTPQQFCVYLACRMLGPCETYLTEIAKLCDFSGVYTVHHHMKSLQAKGFILYNATPRIGTTILWVREAENQQIPVIRGWEAA